MASLTLSVLEIVFLFISAIVVGVVIHFFITTRRTLNKSLQDAKRGNGMDEWKLKYFNDFETKNKELDELKSKLSEISESTEIYEIEIEELRHQNKKLSQELDTAKKNPVVVNPEPSKSADLPKIADMNSSGTRNDYYEQLRLAQQSLIDHNEKISQLLQQVDVIRQSEEKSQEILRSNEELALQIDELNIQLAEKEQEIKQIKQKEHIGKEMSSMLDSAYSEFSSLQDRIRKLEAQLSSSKMLSIEYEDLKESYYKMSREYEDTKSKLSHYIQENHNLQAQLNKVEDKLSEANLQRQQLQKKVAYLEELNKDLQQMSETNKKLENQLKRLGELESKLNLVSEERDRLRGD